ncbi:MAG: transporter substrate-binding protein [Hyphomicrobiales bacterium]|nr:transporter substrate-binding protein [Hyphomicrobiales bacterium]
MLKRTLGAAVAALVYTLAPAMADWRDGPAVKALYEKAKAEGVAVVWGPQRGEVEWLAKAVPEAFPGVAVEFVGDNDVVTRAIAEARGGRHQIDMLWNSVTASVPVAQRNLLAAVDWKALDVPDPQTAFNGQMLYANKVLYSVAYDPKKVKAEDLPRTWDGYLDPKFKGKLAASLFLLPRLTGGLALAWGEEKALQFARDLVNTQDALLTRAPRETFVESGERLLAFGEIENTYRRHALEGKIFGVSIPEPVVMVQFGSTVMAKAPHPNAGRLVAAWLATPEGRAARRKHTGSIDYDTTSQEPFAREMHEGKVQVVFDTPENMEQRDAAIRKATPIVAGRAQ